VVGFGINLVLVDLNFVIFVLCFEIISLINFSLASKSLFGILSLLMKYGDLGLMG